jgi:hypothetical protein
MEKTYNLRRSYHELARLKTFEERYEYLRLSGMVGQSTFGSDRYLNQALYTSPEWKSFRNRIIIRDNGCDLGIEGRDVLGDRIIIHHINPLTVEDVENRSPVIFDPDNVVCVSHNTHQAIHYGDQSLLQKDPVERTPNDTCPWKT